MSAFSIGEEFAPRPMAEAPAAAASSKALEVPTSPQPKEKDELMEALMDLDDEGGWDDDGGIEEIAFDDDDADVGDGPAKEEAIVSHVPNLPIQPASGTVAASGEGTAAQSSDEVVAPDAAAAASAIETVNDAADSAVPAESSTNLELATAPNENNNVASKAETPGIPAEVKAEAQEKSEEDTDLSSGLAELGDELGNLDMGDDTADDLGDVGDFDDFDDFEEDEDLADLENFLTKVSSS